MKKLLWLLLTPKEDTHATIPRLRRLKALHPLQLELVVGSDDPYRSIDVLEKVC